MRLLLADPDTDQSHDAPGVVVRRLDDASFVGETPLRVGDRVTAFARRPIHHFLDFMRVLRSLRAAPTPVGGTLGKTDALLDPSLPYLVQDEPTGGRWVEVAFLSRGTGAECRGRLLIQSLPLADVAPTMVWFLCQLGILSVGALAVWHRPFDASARVFYLMCTASLCAFVGSFHWWVMAGAVWLTAPFVICAAFVPVLTLHFFLLYPRPVRWMELQPRLVTSVIYAPAVIALGFFLAVESLLWIGLLTDAYGSGLELRRWLLYLRAGVYAYVLVACVYFVGTLVAIINSFRATRSPLELNQVQSILWAALIAAGCIGYTLYLAFFWRADFALGGGRWPMFVASLVFMAAYVVGISRYKLMLIDQILSRGMWYYVLTSGSNGLASVGVAGCSLAAVFWNGYLTRQQTWLVAILLAVVVGLFIWLRDLSQRWIDRQFFREKYQLDKTLQRMNQAVGQLTETPRLAERMLASCREVLQSEEAALYLRDPAGDAFRLAASTGSGAPLPASTVLSPDVAALLNGATLLIRSSASEDDRLAQPLEALFAELHAALIQGLEVEGAVSGFVVLGPKQGGGAYSAEDLTFLATLGQITGVALHCANVHADLGRLHEELRSKLDRISQQRQQIVALQAELASLRNLPQEAAPGEFRREMIRGNSASLMRVLDTARKVAASDATVLLRGESGTGKELLARALHENGPRAKGPLVAVHCGALSPSLLESELFGHVRGAFTGANADKRGRFELADGGTLFLDEIGDISMETQIKLLRVLQERSFERVGGSDAINVNVRLIAATHQPLERLIADGRFREDLYYRLNVISLTLPPLRERRDDLLDLCTFFLQRATERTGKGVTHFDDDALDLLLRFDWPGNIRQLENVIERAVVLAEGPAIVANDLPPDLQSTERSLGGRTTETLSIGPTVAPPADWRLLDDRTESLLLRQALQRAQGNKALAARLLGLPRSTFFSKLKKFALVD